MDIDIKQGNCLEVLKGMDSESVDMCITSPPYWGLRDYGSEPSIWDGADGADGCEHEWGIVKGKKNIGRDDQYYGSDYGASTWKENPKKPIDSSFCIKCNAWKGNLGLEPTYQLFIDHLIQIFDEVKRVLKDTGTCWVNLGDSYSGSGGDHKENGKNDAGFQGDLRRGVQPKHNTGIQAKSLIGIPERFCIAMTDAGWIRRNTIIWYKPNCMPSSADDRFTVDFEYLYFFTKKTKYWFEQQFEPHSEHYLSERSKYTVFTGNKEVKGSGRADGASNTPGIKSPNPNGRNKRCVWKIPPQSYSDAHFATYPEELVYTPIKAGCPKDGTVLDPFMGSGTTLKVARELGRKGIGIELNEEYIDMAKKRIGLEQAVFGFK